MDSEKPEILKELRGQLTDFTVALEELLGDYVLSDIIDSYNMRELAEYLTDRLILYDSEAA